jgi:SAM-dependent methyltransferase
VDTWKFYDITHREHTLLNPMSLEKLDRLIRLLRLAPGTRVVDIASGKGEFLFRLAEAYGTAGTGVDISPFFVATAREKLAGRAPDAEIEFVEMDGAKFQPDAWESFGMASCLGASWIFKGHRSTLEALVRMTVPGGWVVAGEPYWRKEPSADYLATSGESRDMFGTHEENVATGEALGLTLAYTIVSSTDDWDVYEGLQWFAVDAYAREHPDDPDLAEVVERIAKGRDVFLRWGRETLGWAIYAFRRPAG